MRWKHGNRENNKSYPDIISVIRMSDLYSVSLDHLLKEEKSMNQTKQSYQEFLAESTNSVKAKGRLEKVVLLSTYFIVWVITMAILWQVKGPAATDCAIAFRWILLPLVLLTAAILIAKHNYWGRGNWLAVPGAAITYLAVPYTEFVEETGTGTFTFCFPNFGYMLVGIAVAVCGICIGALWAKVSVSD